MSTKKKTAIVLISAIVFFAVTMPFRRIFHVVSVTEVRPAAALNPTCGLLFGIYGALGCAIGNLAADLISGYSPLMCVLGFLVQMIYGLIPHFVWKSFHSEVRLNVSINIIRYMIISGINTAVTSILLGISMYITGIGEVFSMTTLMLFLNNFVFCVILGIPIILGYTKIRLKKIDQDFSMNEIFILIFLFLAILSATIMGTFAFKEISGYITDLLELWNKVYIYISLDLLLFSTVVVCVLHYAEKQITIPMEELSAIASEYCHTEDDQGLNTKWIVQECQKYKHVHGEAGELAKAFGEMAVNIENYVDRIMKITAENERIGAELNVATQIQEDMLPRIFPPFPDKNEFELYASMDPAKEVGGDFYDFFLIDENHLALIIADVSGKGVPAALFMVIAKTLIKNRAQMGGSPSEILRDVNEQLCEGNEAELFVTVWLAILEISTGKGIASNAGHEYPAVRRADGKYELIKNRHSPAVAVMEGIRFREYPFELHKGDSLFVYTDGVTEATNAENTLFGTERLLNALNKNPAAAPEELLRNVREEIDIFVEDAPQFDDITMLGLFYSGKEENHERIES